MSLEIKSKTTGGDKLKAHLRDIDRKRRALHKSPSVEVGFFRTARYQVGTYVASVAAWQEFGVIHPRSWYQIPSRPFFREALRLAKPEVTRLLTNVEVLPERKVLGQVGLYVKGQIQVSIRTGNWQENTAEVKARKAAKGAVKTKDGEVLDPRPLIDTGLLIGSVSWKYTRG